MTSLGGEQGNGGNGWRATIIAGLGTAVVLGAGWIATDSTTARQEMVRQVNQQGQEIAALKESSRYMQASQARIEATLDEIRRQLQERRR